jgi:hypothetical protein
MSEAKKPIFPCPRSVVYCGAVESNFLSVTLRRDLGGLGRSSERFGGDREKGATI